MKRFKWLLIGSMVSCLAIILLAGCGVSQSEYEALQAEHATLLEQNTSLKAELESLQTEHTALMEQNAPLKGELERVQSNLTNMEEAYATLEKERAAIEVQLTEIKTVYPPKHFANRPDLVNWLDKRLPELSQSGGIGRHLELQEMALADGYIWSIACQTLGGVVSDCIAGYTIYSVDIHHGHLTKVAVIVPE